MWPLDPALEGKRLYLLRHGKTYEPHPDARMATAAEDPELPLTPDGVDGVEATARALASAKLESAFSSTFRRSLDTAQRIGRTHGLEVTTRTELEELRVYPEDGDDLRATARAYVAIARQLQKTPAGEVRLGSDPHEPSLGAVISGATRALHECLKGPARRVLVVAHGGLNRLLLTRLLDVPLHRFIGIDQDFGCVNVIEFGRRGRPWVRALNATVDDPFKSGEIRL